MGDVSVAIQRTILETIDTTRDDRCDLCRQGEKAFIYVSRTPLERHSRVGTVTTQWRSETIWELCRTCSILVEDRDRHALAQRLIRFGGVENAKQAFKTVTAFFEHLISTSRQPLLVGTQSALAVVG